MNLNQVIDKFSKENNPEIKLEPFEIKFSKLINDINFIQGWNIQNKEVEQSKTWNPVFLS